MVYILRHRTHNFFNIDFIICGQSKNFCVVAVYDSIEFDFLRSPSVEMLI